MGRILLSESRTGRGEQRVAVKVTDKVTDIFGNDGLKVIRVTV